jgi:hypothetical protein
VVERLPTPVPQKTDSHKYSKDYTNSSCLISLIELTFNNDLFLTPPKIACKSNVLVHCLFSQFQNIKSTYRVVKNKTQAP